MTYLDTQTEIRRENEEAKAPVDSMVIRIAQLRKALPYAGRGGGVSKIGGACPHCGGISTYRYTNDRWKRCSSCGYDRLEESIFDHIRAEVKRGRSVNTKRLERALKYWDAVYG